MRIFFIATLCTTLISAVIMGWIAKDFYFRDGHHFSVMALEMPDSMDELRKTIQQIEPDILQRVRLNLYTDFIFMLGCYPFVALLCLIVARKSGKKVASFFWGLAFLQIFPFVFDAFENISLLQWIEGGDGLLAFGIFKFMVTAKFTIALGGYLLCSVVIFFRSLNGTQIVKPG